MAQERAVRLTTIQRLADIPDFASEEEEASYWATHTLAPHLLRLLRPLTGDEAPRPGGAGPDAAHPRPRLAARRAGQPQSLT